jgi:acetyl esterase/lipase
MNIKLLLFLMTISCTVFSAEIKLWKGDMPGTGAENPEAISSNKKGNVIRLTYVSEPTLTFYPAANTDKTNPMVIVCPGGGYTILAMDLEGSEIAEWLNSIGVSAAVLKYRVPGNREGALQDARRAVQLVREKASDWNVDPHRVGIMGFSAGGHLAAATSNSPDRPDFTILIYPAYLYKGGGIELTDEIKVNTNTPPAFVVQTRDDKKYYRSSLAYTTALDKEGISVELHLFSKGGHGYGLRPSKHSVSTWPVLCEHWLSECGFLNLTRDEPKP